MFPCCSKRRSRRCRCARRPLSRRHVRRRRLYARAAGARRPRRRRSTAIPRRSPAARRWRREYPERLRLVEARFGELDAHARRPRRRRARHRRLLDAARPGRARLLAALRRAARHADGGRGRDGGRHSCARPSVDELADIFFHFGEERAARRIARAIVADRDAAPFVSTLQLAGLVARVAPAPPGERTHPATRVFQALRIAVNDELGQLQRGLAAAERALKPGGRLAVVTFHSLEDRIVKQFLASRSRSRPRRLAPAAGRAGAGAAELSRVSRPAGHSERARDRRQPARALRETALRRAPRRAAPIRRSTPPRIRR